MGEGIRFARGQKDFVVHAAELTIGSTLQPASLRTMSNSDQLLRQFELARRDLLELTTINRLLSTPRDKEQGAAIEIHDESATDVFRMLVHEGSSMRFEEGEIVEVEPSDSTESSAKPAAEAPSEPTEDAAPKLKSVKRRTTKKKTTRTDAAPPAEEDEDAPQRMGLLGGDVSKKSSSARAFGDAKNSESVSATDDVLHTILAPEELDRRLQALIEDSATLMQEQGVNVLYLALGFLKWYENEAPETARSAPLLLIPATLEKGRGGKRYSLAWSEGDIETNLTLKVRLKADFGIALPDVPATEDLSPITYFQDVQKAIAGQRGWEVRQDDIVLWCFSFTRLLMYRDLDPGNWPHDKRLEDRPLIKSLLQEGFPPAEPLCKPDECIDPLFDVAQTMHVIDCDSSQSVVIEEAARGRNLVIQGPPGTGKSQTITNLIAAAVTSGKTILFVAEKMAALEVVKRRLDNIGIGDMCLELHSKMSNKRVVLQEVDRTLKLGTPKLPSELPKTVKRLKECQQSLNSFADKMHAVYAKSGITPYQTLGELIDLRAASTPLPDFQLPEAADWTADEYAKKLEAITDFCKVIAKIGDPAKHPWRGSTLDQILPLDLERLLATAPQRVADLDTATEAASQLTQRLNDDPATTLGQVARLLRTVDALMKAPELDTQPMAGMVWADHRQAIKELVDHARAILAAKQKLTGKVTEAAWDVDVAADVQAYSIHGRCWTRMFRSSYRKARHTLKSLLTGPQPATFEERLEILELLNKRQVANRKLAEAGSFGEKAFGRFWMGPQTDLNRLVAWEQWDDATVKSGVSPRFRGMLSLLAKKDEIKLLALDVAKKLETFLAGYKALGETLKLDFKKAFSVVGSVLKSAPASTAGPADAKSSSPPTAASSTSSGTATTAEKARSEDRSGYSSAQFELLTIIADAPVAEVRERLVSWSKDPEGLQQWQIYRRTNAAAASIGKGALVERITDGKIAPTDGAAVFRFARAEALLRAMLKTNPELEQFDGGKFEELIDDFCTLDIKRLELARAEVAASHWDGIGRKRPGNMAEAVQLLKHEMQKQRRHLPLRELLSKAGTAVQAVKPVFMMSPLSVAQYLEPGVLEFDMLLIDEASQVRPVEALGAAARCRQMVVVGDDKQMPPTQFFGRVLGDVKDDDSPEMQAGDVESILGLAIARNMPQRMLRWHYRSKHESLIAVSNREFYDSQLYVVPSPERTGELGVKWHFVDGGKFVKGKNDVEAKIVAEAIIRHAKERPKWTLGVAAFSVSQRDAILDELAKLLKTNPGLESFFDPNAPDPFFVKNLENVQGDERDAIFVSVGYGPGEDGKVSLNFGPVSSSGGERRLNVLMTRAKRVLEMFSSMHAEDIDLTRATGRGPAVFREYLRFAEKGGTADSAKTGTSHDRFVEVLSKQLTDRGYSVKASVGIAGLYVDLAVVDPNNSNRYVLGVIVDGDTWKSARSGRDRFRTTDGVLNGQGWIIHHVWSLEWFKRPTEQLNHLVETIEAARAGRVKKKDARLASTTSEIPRTPGGPDPLSMAVGSVEAMPPRVDRPTSSTSTSEADGGGLLTDILTKGLEVGAAVLIADKGKGLDAAIDQLTKGSKKDKKK